MARFHTKPKIVPFENDWFWLSGDLVFEFTLREALKSYTPELKRFAELGYDVDEKVFIVVPKGFVTDLASVPKGLTFILPRDGDYRLAAIVHDMIYGLMKENTVVDREADNFNIIQLLNEDHTRFLADRIFLLGMRTLGTNSVVRGAMYNAVRLGGHDPYTYDNTIENYGVDLINIIYYNLPYLAFRAKESVGINPDRFMGNVEDTKNMIGVQYINLKRYLVLFDEDEFNVNYI